MKTLARLLLLTIFSSASAAHAAEPARFAPGDPLPGHDGATYLDLLRAIAPDIALADTGAATGHLAAPLLYSDGEESAAAGDAVAIDQLMVLPFRSEGKERLLLLVDLGDGGERVESFTAAALFDDVPAPRLLDVLDVSTDRFTGFFHPPVLDLSPDDQAFVVENGHWNAGQSYDATTLLFARGGRLQEIASVFTFSDTICGFERRQSPHLEAVTDAGAPYAGIHASVVDEGVTVEEDCGDDTPPTPYHRLVEATYRWDAAAKRFVADSDALERLAADDADRF